MLAIIRLGLFALLALQIAWHGFLPVPRSPMGWTAFVIAVAPLLMLLPGAWRARPAPLFWVNLLCLVYFCHGVSEAWTVPESRLFAFSEIVLSVAVVSAYGVFGLRSRRAARAAASHHSPAT